MKKLMTMATVALAIAFGATETKADETGWTWSPLGIGIAAPVQLPWTTTSIYGVRFGGFFGWNADVYGIDGSLVGLQSGALYGLQGTAFSWTAGEVAGIQLALLGNVTYENVYGIQLAPVNVNHGENAYGLEIGVVNYGISTCGFQTGALINWNASISEGLQLATVANANQEDFTGASLGLINFANRLNGCQIGGINLADEATGFQFGFVNAADSLRGVQIGFINVIGDSKFLPIMVIANAKF